MEKFIKTDQAALFIKIFTNYTQIISTISTFNLSIPRYTKYTIIKLIYITFYFLSETGAVFESAGTPVKRALFSMDCFLSGLANKDYIPIEYMRLIWTFIVPLIYMSIETFGYVFYSTAFMGLFKK
jgi:hypothetical protein